MPTIFNSPGLDGFIEQMPDDKEVGVRMLMGGMGVAEQAMSEIRELLGMPEGSVEITTKTTVRNLKIVRDLGDDAGNILTIHLTHVPDEVVLTSEQPEQVDLSKVSWVHVDMETAEALIMNDGTARVALRIIVCNLNDTNRGEAEKALGQRVEGQDDTTVELTRSTEEAIQLIQDLARVSWVRQKAIQIAKIAA